MPLHKPIPLCSLTYAGETMSSATFNYDTTTELMKNTPKMLYECDDRIICKGKTQLVEKSNTTIGKTNKVILMDNTVKDILINPKSNIVESQITTITKGQGKVIQELMIDINRSIHYNLNANDVKMDKNNHYGLNINESNLIKNSVINLSLPSTISIDNSNRERSLCVYQKEIIQKITKTLFPEDYIHNLTKFSHRELSNVIMNEIKYYNHLELSSMNDKYVNKSSTDKLLLNNNLVMNKHEQPLYYINESRLRNLTKSAVHNCLYRDNVKSMSKATKAKLNYRYNVYNLDYMDNHVFLNRVNILNMSLSDSTNLIYRLANEYINKKLEHHLVYKLSIKNIHHANHIRGFYRNVIFNILNSNQSKYVDKITNRNISKNSEIYRMDRIHQINIIKSYAYNLFREYFYDTYRNKSIYLEDSRLFNVSKTKSLDLSKLSITNIFMDETKLIGDLSERNIYIEKDKLNLEVTKRWWWLDSTNPKDNLIIPNADYAHMIDLLNNDNFEYLRYSNHPIEWGSNWGKDWNIPPKAISIEIIVDVTNIITMIWHKNVQGWLCCTGKESIQLLMELLYDWYTMDSSNSNSDYYRVFRWVRWEAEKVYFLNTNSGLQAIGILVNNLITYMKNHHFNLVPIWKNPKAMDIERSFNHTPNNNDLMKALDKNKGRRHYTIDSQLEKKDIFRR
jgi:hypothetical protein